MLLLVVSCQRYSGFVCTTEAFVIEDHLIFERVVAGFPQTWKTGIGRIL